MAACGLLMVVSGDGERGGKRSGRKVDWFQKPLWSEVLESQVALDEVNRLELARDHFDN